MSFFEIGVYRGKTEANVGTLWRSAYQLGAAGIFTIYKRYPKQSSDTYKSHRSIPLREYDDWDGFLAARPRGAQLIAIEMGGKPLATFKHPRQAIYLLGAEDHGLPQAVLAQCQHTISLEAVRRPSYNVAVAGSLVMYHRMYSRMTVVGTCRNCSDAVREAADAPDILLHLDGSRQCLGRKTFAEVRG